MNSSMLLGSVFLVLGALVTVSEIHTLTVYLLAVAAGLFAAGGLALAGGSLTADLAVLAVVIVLGLPVAYWWRRRLRNRASDEVTRDDAGRQVTVVSVTGSTLRVDYRGTTWEARLQAGVTTTPVAGDSCVIARREGNVLILVP